MSWQNFITDLVKSGGSPISKMMGSSPQGLSSVGQPGTGGINTRGMHEITPEAPIEEEPDGQEETGKFDWKNFFVPSPQGGQPQSTTTDGSLASGGGQLAGKGIATLLKMFI